MTPDRAYDPIRRCWHFWRFRLEFNVRGTAHHACGKCIAKARIKVLER